MDGTYILVVDDESRMRKLLRDFLTAKGYQILEAEDGEKAIEVFEENRNKIIKYFRGCKLQPLILIFSFQIYIKIKFNTICLIFHSKIISIIIHNRSNNRKTNSASTIFSVS